jgi:hypothetical protein
MVLAIGLSLAEVHSTVYVLGMLEHSRIQSREAMSNSKLYLFYYRHMDYTSTLVSPLRNLLHSIYLRVHTMMIIKTKCLSYTGFTLVSWRTIISGLLLEWVGIFLLRQPGSESLIRLLMHNLQLVACWGDMLVL